MKKLILTTLLTGNFAALLLAGEIRSHIIGNSPLTITVPANHVLRIREFTQAGGGAERGAVTATINGHSATILLATILSSPPGTGSPTPVAPQRVVPHRTALEPINSTIVAGPATVTIAPIAGGTLYINYRKESADQ
jgi:hypothetical protein